jgi:GTPase SAR1 family protein
MRIPSHSQLITNRVKILSLVGEGGIGKTSVSIKLVRQAENSYDITIPVNMKKDMDYQDFLLEVAKFTDLPIVNNLQPDELENLIREIFAKVGQILLWVDNYENVADFIDTAPNSNLLSIHSFLETLPNNVTIILNSRNRSNLEEETIVDIKGLSPEDGMKLFVQMAKRHLMDQPLLKWNQKLEKYANW